jgi:hypothetical protein
MVLQGHTTTVTQQGFYPPGSFDLAGVRGREGAFRRRQNGLLHSGGTYFGLTKAYICAPLGDRLFSISLVAISLVFSRHHGLDFWRQRARPGDPQAVRLPTRFPLLLHFPRLRNATEAEV